MIPPPTTTTRAFVFMKTRVSWELGGVGHNKLSASGHTTQYFGTFDPNFLVLGLL